ncbi:hypothetical protein FA10DRAFT_258675 [Acaromyces ingoldii]|uniref:DUF7918 domain-containing protein n=1 Tax=Acaromyces ingoldii TaxID=215250 RepID=A0A316YRG3_9BASI|nr:hypothetical protein FA10DRAFT_258675 [Acaromyces ingoldii]PWN91258.1 hypothetical protein FA10DRAFT_258675 [Acaromyces ingoldii]
MKLLGNSLRVTVRAGALVKPEISQREYLTPLKKRVSCYIKAVPGEKFNIVVSPGERIDDAKLFWIIVYVDGVLVDDHVHVFHPAVVSPLAVYAYYGYVDQTDEETDGRWYMNPLCFKHPKYPETTVCPNGDEARGEIKICFIPCERCRPEESTPFEHRAGYRENKAKSANDFGVEARGGTKVAIAPHIDWPFGHRVKQGATSYEAVFRYRSERWLSNRSLYAD